MNGSEADERARERWQRLEALFDEVVDRPATERAELLAGADAALAAEVLDLVAASASSDDALRDIVAREASRLTEEAAGVAVGARLDDYLIVSKLGEGGMGVVYLAERAAGERRERVAIKVLLNASPQAIARFRDERQILATLDHPGIVRLLDGGHTEAGLPYLVMDYIDGVPLTRHARAGGLTVERRLALFTQVCDAVQYAHDQRVVHRDLKPSNILVTADGRAHLLDFGIARLMDPDAALGRHARTRTGMPLLTPEYASPEQARGGPVSNATDVYSLGAVLFELLTGAPVIQASPDPLELLRRICEVEPPRPSAMVPASERRALAGALDAIVLKALEKDPARRHASVAELADDVRHHLAGRPVTPRTFGARAVRLATRHRGMLVLSMLVIAALAVAIALALGDPRSTASPAETPESRVEVSAAPPADPEPRRVDLAPIRDKLVVLKDGDGGIYAVVPGPGGRAFYAAGGGQKRLYEQVVLQRIIDASTGRWGLTVWTPGIGWREPGSIARDADGSHARWCGARRTPLVEVTGGEARAILESWELRSTPIVREPYLLARDDAGVYYYVDTLREEYGHGGYRVLIGPKGALKRQPLSDVAVDGAGEVFATPGGELRIVRDTPAAAPVTVTWVHGSERVPLSPLDLRVNAALIYRELGVYGFTGAICEPP